MIRKLDITILKGILENRSSDSWACFIVEVAKYVSETCFLMLIVLRGATVFGFQFGMIQTRVRLPSKLCVYIKVLSRNSVL